jgi:hypothetical protein
VLSAGDAALILRYLAGLADPPTPSAPVGTVATQFIEYVYESAEWKDQLSRIDTYTVNQSTGIVNPNPT